MPHYSLKSSSGIPGCEQAGNAPRRGGAPTETSGTSWNNLVQRYFTRRYITPLKHLYIRTRDSSQNSQLYYSVRDTRLSGGSPGRTACHEQSMTACRTCTGRYGRSRVQAGTPGQGGAGWYTGAGYTRSRSRWQAADAKPVVVHRCLGKPGLADR